MNARSFLAFLLLALISAPLYAQDSETITIYSENDSPYYKPNNSTDRYRTNASGISLHYQPQWTEDLAPYMPLSDEFGPAEYGGGFVLGHQIFTPKDITVSSPQPNDRPWAAHLFIGAFWQRSREDRSVHDHLQFDLGIVGPAARGEQLQKTVHRILDSPRPEGWDHQIPNEVTANLHLRRTWRIFETQLDAVDPNLKYEFLPKVGWSYGNELREVRAGVTGRIGWKLPDDFGPGRLLNLGDATGTYQKGFSAYLFGRATGRVVQHDIFLDGVEFDSSPSVDREPFVGETQLGFKLAYRSSNWQFNVGYGQTFISKQFDNQDGKHGFGMWTLSLTQDF